MSIQYCSIGHVSLDLIHSKQHPGGSVLFGASLANDLGQKSGVVTSSAPNFPFAEHSDIEWSIQFSGKTTTYQLDYIDDHREIKLLQKADVIQEQSVIKSLRNANVVMLAPIVDEIQPELISIFSTQWIGLTPQGWFRRFDPEGKMFAAESFFSKLPKKIKLIVVSSEDLPSGSNDWEWIKNSAEIAVCTMGKDGYVLAYGGTEKKYAPLEVMKEKNPTGCGDIFATAALLLLSRGLTPEKACEKAGHAAALASTQDQMIDSIRIAAQSIVSEFI